LLWLDREDLRERPLEDRRELLTSLMSNVDERLVLAERVEGSEAEALATARERGLEGLLAKRRGSTYRTAVRNPDWRKLKVTGNTELVIAGFTPISSGESAVGSLLLAQRKGSRWTYAGKVGTGFDWKMRQRLWRMLSDEEVPKSLVDDAPRLRKA